MDWDTVFQTMLLGSWAIAAYKMVTMDTAEVAERITKAIVNRPKAKQGQVAAAIRIATLPSEKDLRKDLKVLQEHRDKALKKYLSYMADGYPALASGPREAVVTLEKRITQIHTDLYRLKYNEIER